MSGGNFVVVKTEQQKKLECLFYAWANAMTAQGCLNPRPVTSVDRERGFQFSTVIEKELRSEQEILCNNAGCMHKSVERKVIPHTVFAGDPTSIMDSLANADTGPPLNVFVIESLDLLDFDGNYGMQDPEVIQAILSIRRGQPVSLICNTGLALISLSSAT